MGSTTPPSSSTATVQIDLKEGDEVTCTYSNTVQVPDVGALKIIKTVDAGGSNFTSGSFDVQADCGTAGTFNRTITYPTDGFVTIGDLPTGTECTVTETGKPTPPSGYSWGTEAITGSPATITFGGIAEVTVANSLSHDQGYLKIKKVFDPLTSGFTGNFTINYDCGGTNTGNVSLAAGATSTAIGPFDTGTAAR